MNIRRDISCSRMRGSITHSEISKSERSSRYIMDRRRFLKIAGQSALSLTGAAALGSLAAGCAQSGTSRKPNFIFILIDDMGWKDVGYMGSDYYETPHIDRLASQGMQFTNAYSNAPNCAPTRACLMSGQYSPRHGVYTVGNPARGSTKLRKLVPTPNDTTLNGDVVTLAESLAGAGYVSASMGKWHLGNDPELGPVGQGFDVNIAGDEHGHPPAGYFAPYELPNVENAPEDEYLTDRLTDEAVEFIKTNQDRPFFLYLPHYSVHLPLHAKEKIIEKYRNKPASGGHNNP
ncbi:MAG: sulfatase-like hydrolase/transferase, partial [Candidatus Marinimicrobia bacterium]|nr:sulfatase-like hydrolase/transferase [Candidatus Neomarinimicrobiota bacterium]